MRPATAVYLFEGDVKFFGEGPRKLLRGVEKEGSLRAAAQAMDMSYTKASNLVKRAEKALGFPLTEKTIGGKDGGGSRLTAEAKAFLEKYEAYQEACREANSRIYREIFSE